MKPILYLVALLCLLVVLSEGYRLTKEKAEAIQKELSEEESLEHEKRQSGCPNACSNHGTCSGGQCSCYDNYSGTDCSIEIRRIFSGVPVSGRAELYSWKYYWLPLQYRGNLGVEMNQTSTGDCDIYVGQNSPPTRTVFYQRDISTKSRVTFQLQGLSPGNWYFGVYGFQACNFTLKVSMEGTCPNGCSGQGSCLSGNCVCNPGWSGVDCSERVTQLTINGPATVGYVGLTQWKYYNFQYSSSSTNLVTVTLTQTTPGDADLYIRYQNAPTEFQYDYANITTKSVSTIRMTQPRSGSWFIGIHGFAACNFTLSVSTSGGCPNQCSKHGQCNGISCVCNSGYSGDNCQTRDVALQNGIPDQGYVSASNWNYFRYDSASVANLMISLQTTGGDCDIYAKSGSLPSRISYDASDVGTRPNFTLTIEDPGIASWYIGIYGWSTCSFTITVYETSACPPGCSVNGRCNAGFCECNPGWSGEACDQRTNALRNNLPITDSITGGRSFWNYYTFSTVNSTSAHFALRETSTDGWLWLFVGKATPTLRNYDFADTETNTGLHKISINLDQEQSTTFYIGVYANPYSLGNNISYQLIAWSPNF